MDINMEKPLVSVVIPCYNHERFVQDCIESVLKQDYEEIELIIIDDGSKDNSVSEIEALIPECEKRFVRFEFRKRPNKGLCATLNEAISWCYGDYFLVIASDDVMMDDRVKRQVNLLSTQSDSVALFGSVFVIDDNSQVVKRGGCDDKVIGFEDVLMNRAKLYAPTMLARMSEIKKAAPIPEDIKIEDRYLQLCMTQEGGFIITSSEVYAKYRRHAHNTSNNVLALFEDNVKLIELFNDDASFKKKCIARNMLGCALSLRKVDKGNAWKMLMRSVFFDPLLIFNWRFSRVFVGLVVNV
jgi:alpha-1,3-rhamnosyltransferase